MLKKVSISLHDKRADRKIRRESDVLNGIIKIKNDATDLEGDLNKYLDLIDTDKPATAKNLKNDMIRELRSMEMQIKLAKAQLNLL